MQASRRSSKKKTLSFIGLVKEQVNSLQKFYTNNDQIFTETHKQFMNKSLRRIYKTMSFLILVGAIVSITLEVIAHVVCDPSRGRLESISQDINCSNYSNLIIWSATALFFIMMLVAEKVRPQAFILAFQISLTMLILGLNDVSVLLSFISLSSSSRTAWIKSLSASNSSNLTNTTNSTTEDTYSPVTEMIEFTDAQSLLSNTVVSILFIIIGMLSLQNKVLKIIVCVNTIVILLLIVIPYYGTVFWCILAALLCVMLLSHNNKLLRKIAGDFLTSTAEKTEITYLLSSIQEGVYLVDGDGKSLYTNQQFLDMMELHGVPRDIYSFLKEESSHFHKITRRIKSLNDNESESIGLPPSTTGRINAKEARSAKSLIRSATPNTPATPATANKHRVEVFMGDKSTLYTIKSLDLIIEDHLKNLTEKGRSITESPEKDFEIYDMEYTAIAENDDLTTTVNSRGKKSLELRIKSTTFNGRIGIILIFLDTTKARRILELKSKDEYKTNLLSSVSHELRTPLNCSIGLLAEAMADHTLLSDHKEQYILPSLSTSKLMSFMIDDIIDYSTIHTDRLNLRFQAFDLRQSIVELAQLFVYVAGLKQLKLDIQIDSGVPQTIFSEKKRLTQILVNLLSNAVKFTERGKIIIEINTKIKTLPATHPIPIDEADVDVSISESNYNNPSQTSLVISVKDTGIGMSEEVQKNLTRVLKNPRGFHMVKTIRNSKGSCLGLSIAQSLLKMIGSTGLVVNSTVDEGTTCSFTIPISTADESGIQTPGGTLNKKQSNVNNSDFWNSVPKYCLRGNTGQTFAFAKQSTPTHKQLYIYEDPKTPMSPLAGWELQSVDIIQKPLVNKHNPNPILEPSEVNRQERDAMSLKVLPMKNPFVKKSQAQTQPQLKLEAPAILVNSQKIEIECCCTRILLVDDNDFNLLTLKTQLENRGFTVFTASNGKLALVRLTEIVNNDQHRCLANLRCRYLKVIFMDVEMPVMNGLECTSEMVTRMDGGEYPRIPIIGVSAFDSDEDIHDAVEAGMIQYIKKPVLEKELEAILRFLDTLYEDGDEKYSGYDDNNS